MKLFLSSISVHGELLPYFLSLVNKPAKEIDFVLIENAADLYPEESKGFMYRTRTDLESIGMRLERLDLNDYLGKRDALKEKLAQSDVVWIGGGNTYYIRYLMRQSGFDQIIRELVANGLVYAGGSAGAIVAGPLITRFQDTDEPENGPVLIEEGLSLTDLVIVPHWDQEKYRENLEEIKQYYDNQTSYQTVALTDDQAVIVTDEQWHLIP